MKKHDFGPFGPFWPFGAPKALIFGTPGQFLTKKFFFASKTLFYAIRTNLKLFLKKNLAKNYFFRPPGENFFRPARPARRPLVGPAGAAKIAKNVITGTSNPSETIKRLPKPQKSVQILSYNSFCIKNISNLRFLGQIGRFLPFQAKIFRISQEIKKKFRSKNNFF